MKRRNHTGRSHHCCNGLTPDQGSTASAHGLLLTKVQRWCRRLVDITRGYELLKHHAQVKCHCCVVLAGAKQMYSASSLCTHV